MSAIRSLRGRLVRPARDLLVDVGTFLFPLSCLVCRAPLPPRRPLVICRACRGRLIPVRGPTCLVCRGLARGADGYAAGRHCDDSAHAGFRVYAAVQMVEPADGLVHALKFHDRPDVGASLAVFMARRLAAEGVLRCWDTVLPMPLHPVRERMRGYNQSTEIGVRLARSLGARCPADVLVRSRATRAQADLDYTDRSGNVSGAFRVREGRRASDPRALEGARCLVVDDVATTGHTLLAALEALRDAGPGKTGAAVFALA